MKDFAKKLKIKGLNIANGFKAMKLMLNMPLKILLKRWYYKNTERPTSQMPFTMKNHNLGTLS